MSIEIKLDNGKYTYILNDKEHKALRHGKEWRDLTGDNLILNMGFEIEALRTQLAKANERVRELERKVESEKFKKEEFVRWVDRLIEEQKELREQRFRAFGDDEYLIFFDDGEDYPESMVAPVVMSADKFRELYYAREQLRKEQE